jgi:hypothetical protein
VASGLNKKRRMLEALQTGEPFTVQELAQVADCSGPHAQLFVQSLRDDAAIKPAGKTETGAMRYRWVPEEERAARDGEDALWAEGAAPVLDDKLTVVSTTRVSTTEVEMLLRRVSDGATFRATIRA